MDGPRGLKGRDGKNVRLFLYIYFYNCYLKTNIRCPFYSFCFLLPSDTLNSFEKLLVTLNNFLKKILFDIIRHFRDKLVLMVPMDLKDKSDNKVIKEAVEQEENWESQERLEHVEITEKQDQLDQKEHLELWDHVV